MKVNNKSERSIFIGYNNKGKGYRLYNPQMKNLIIRRDVIFYESTELNTYEISIEEKVKITSQGVKFDPLPLHESSSHDDSSPPEKVPSL